MTQSEHSTGHPESSAAKKQTKRELSQNAFKKQLHLRHDMEAQLKSHGFNVVVAEPVEAHGYTPTFTVRTLRISLNGTYLGSYNSLYNRMMAEDPRLAAWAHIMGVDCYATQRARKET